MKTTAICRFDGTTILVRDNNLMTFQNYECLQNYCSENNIKVEIEHWHPASGLRVQRNGG